MKAQHTPGDWTLRPDDTQPNPYWYGAAIFSQTRLIARLEMTDAQGDGEANARLFVAAPALLAALERAKDLAYRLSMKAPGLNPDADAILLQAHTAIAAAKGET